MLSVPAAGNRRGHFSLPSAPPKKGAQLQEHCSLGHLARTLNSDVHALSCFSHVRLSVTLWTVARRAPLATEFSRQEYWSGLLCPFPGDLLDPGIKSVSLMSPALAGRFLIPLSPPGKPLNSGKEWVIHFWGLVMGTWKDKEKKTKLFYWFWKSTIELKIYLKQKKKNPYIGFILEMLKNLLLENNQFRIGPSPALGAVEICDSAIFSLRVLDFSVYHSLCLYIKSYTLWRLLNQLFVLTPLSISLCLSLIIEIIHVKY